MSGVAESTLSYLFGEKTGRMPVSKLKVDLVKEKCIEGASKICNRTFGLSRKEIDLFNWFFALTWSEEITLLDDEGEVNHYLTSYLWVNQDPGLMARIDNLGEDRYNAIIATLKKIGNMRRLT